MQCCMPGGCPGLLASAGDLTQWRLALLLQLRGAAADAVHHQLLVLACPACSNIEFWTLPHMWQTPCRNKEKQIRPLESKESHTASSVLDWCPQDLTCLTYVPCINHAHTKTYSLVNNNVRPHLMPIIMPYHSISLSPHNPDR